MVVVTQMQLIGLNGVAMVTMQVELELSLPTDGDNYSNSKGESIVRRIECGMNESSYKRCVGIM